MMYYISSSILNSSLFIVWGQLTGEKANFKKIRTVILYLVAVLFIIINYKYANEFLRVLNTFLMFIIAAKFLFNKTIKHTIILGIYSFLLCAIAETIVALLSYFVFHQTYDIANPYVFIMNNTSVSVIFILLSSLDKVKKFYNYILGITIKLTGLKTVLFSLLILCGYNIFTMSSYYETDVSYLIFLSFMFTFVSCLIVFLYLKGQNEYAKIYEKYNLSIENIREYEGLLEQNKINNHENRNQLMQIRNMIKDKKTIKYIDSLLNNELNDDEQLLLETNKIPNGGLRGLIYAKLLIMKSKKINFEVSVGKRLNSSVKKDVDDSELSDICMVIGVFIDNAIEAVKKLKEKYIVIELYKEGNDILISITNNYIGYIDLRKMGELGYTNKGTGRGYGLSLVNNIVKRNPRLENRRELVEDNFTQILKIKTKKK